MPDVAADVAHGDAAAEHAGGDAANGVAVVVTRGSRVVPLHSDAVAELVGGTRARARAGDADFTVRHHRAVVVHRGVAGVRRGGGVASVVRGSHRDVVVGVVDAAAAVFSYGEGRRPGAGVVAGYYGCAATKLGEVNRDAADGVAVVVAAHRVVPGGSDRVAHFVRAASAGSTADADVGIGHRGRYVIQRDRNIIHRGGCKRAGIGRGHRDRLAGDAIDRTRRNGITRRPDLRYTDHDDRRATTKLAEICRY